MTTFKLVSASGEVLYEEDRTVSEDGNKQMTVNHVIGSSFISVPPTHTIVLITLPVTDEDGEVVIEEEEEVLPEEEEEVVVEEIPEPEPEPVTSEPEAVRY